MPFALKGVSGTVWVGCQRAADLGSWTFTPNGNGGTVTATVTKKNAFYAAQRASEIRLRVGQGEWRWRKGSVDAVAGSGMYRVSGPPEER